jgi:Domain of unknown function (DUF4288)
MWFSASLLFENVHPGQPTDDNLWEDRIVLIQAGSEDEARGKAEALGLAEEFEYTAALGDRVSCQFRAVERVCEIDAETLTDRMELFSRFLKASEARSLPPASQKARAIHKQNPPDRAAR